MQQYQRGVLLVVRQGWIVLWSETRFNFFWSICMPNLFDNSHILNLLLGDTTGEGLHLVMEEFLGSLPDLGRRPIFKGH